MNVFTKRLGVLVLAVLVSGQAASQQPVMRPAADGIFEAFKVHPLVGLSDEHGLVQGTDFYAALVRDPRFAREVGHIVFEAGTARHQGIIDRYLSGETVSYLELRKVWTDTVGAVPDAGNIGFANFFTAVRRVNKSLEPNRRIRVWLGDPPLDWSAAKPEWNSALRLRDSHPAELILQNILAKGRKALVIYGAYHFTTEKDPYGGGTLYGRVEEKHPDAFFRVVPYTFSHRPAACESVLKQAEKSGPLPVLAILARSGAADPGLRECATFPSQQSPGSPGNRPEPFDGVLFFGPIETLTQVGSLPDFALDNEYRRETGRRSKATGLPLLRWPMNWTFRKSAYEADLEVPDYAERLTAMFAAHDRNNDGIVTDDEYEDAVPFPELALNAQSFATLAGTWSGTAGPGKARLLILKDRSGRVVGHYIDENIGIRIPVAEAQLRNGTLVAKLEATAGTPPMLTLKMSGNTLTGTMVSPEIGNPARVTLTRK